MIKKIKIIVLVLVMVFLAGCVVNALVYPFLGQTPPPDTGDPGDVGKTPDDPDPVPTPPDLEEPPVTEPDPNWIPRPKYVRGLYLSGYGAGYAPLRDGVINLINASELNSVVVNVKDDNGNVTYRDTKVQLAIDAKANMHQVNMEAFMELLREHQIYPIARIVIFKDKFMAAHKPEWTLKDKNGSVWKDIGGNPWIDPRNKEYWDYIRDLAIEAYELGFREIQLDYVRWPSDGAVKNIADMPPSNLTNQGPYLRAEAITEFISWLSKELEPYNVELSADTFGLVGSVPHEMNIGQQLDLLLDSGLDIICPMIYPGHYAKGTYGLPNPNRAPYQTVYQSLKDHLERMNAAGSTIIMRPWLQDFNDSFDREYIYGEQQIRDQIRAARELGVKEYLIWNAGNRYNQKAYTNNYQD